MSQSVIDRKMSVRRRLLERFDHVHVQIGANLLVSRMQFDRRRIAAACSIDRGHESSNCSPLMLIPVSVVSAHHDVLSIAQATHRVN